MRRSHRPAASRRSGPFLLLECLERREVLSGLMAPLPPFLRPILDATPGLVSTVNSVAGLAPRPPQATPPSAGASLSPAPFSSWTGGPAASGPILLPQLQVGLDLAASVLGISLNAWLSAGTSGNVPGGPVGAAVNVPGVGLGGNTPQGAGGPGLINVGLQLSGGGESLQVEIGAGGTANAAGGPQAVPTVPPVAPALVGASNGRTAADQEAAAAPLVIPAAQSGGTPDDATPDAAGGPPPAGGRGEAVSPPAPAALPALSTHDSPAGGDETLLWEQFRPHGFGPFADFLPLGHVAAPASLPLQQLAEPAWRSIEITLGLTAAAVALALCEAVRRKTRRNQAAQSTYPEWDGPELT